MYDPNKSNFVPSPKGGTAYAPGVNPQFANQPNWQAGANTFRNSPYGQNPSPLGKSLLAANQSAQGSPPVSVVRSTYRPPSGDPRVDQAYKDASGRGREGILSGRYAIQNAMDAQAKGYSVVVSPEAAQAIERPQENTISQYAAYLNKALKKGPQAYEEAMRLVRQALASQPLSGGRTSRADIKGMLLSPNGSISPQAKQAYVDAYARTAGRTYVEPSGIPGVNVGPSGQPSGGMQSRYLTLDGKPAHPSATREDGTMMSWDEYYNGGKEKWEQRLALQKAHLKQRGR